MMCSIEELGSNRDMYPEAPELGIYIFKEDVPVGADAVGLLGLNDAVFEGKRQRRLEKNLSPL